LFELSLVRGVIPMGLAVNSLDASGLSAAAQRILICSSVAGYVLISAIGLGLKIIRLVKLRGHYPWERLVLSAGLGLGSISLLVLGLGLLGLLSPTFWVLLLGGFIVISLGDLFHLFGELTSDFRVMRPKGGFEYWVAVALLVIFAANFLAAFVPPMDYDVLEYHLAAPAEYVRAGRVFFIGDNVYANFPANVEMLFLLAMRLSGGTFAGAYTSKLLNVALGVLAAIGIWRIGARLFTRRVGAIGAAIFYSAPWVSSVTQKAYVEGGTVFFGIMVMLAAARYWVGPVERRQWREAAAAGVFSGFAIGTKYPAALFVAIPAGLFFLVANLSARRHLLRHTLVFVLCALALVSPWLIKNYVLTGNPIYPLLYNVFDGPKWDEVRDARFAQAHSAGGVGGKEFGLAAGGYFFLDALASPLVVVFAPFFLVYAAGGRRRIALFLYAGFVFLSWFFFTHRISRFLIPMVPALAILGGCGVEADLGRWWRAMCRALFGVLLAYCAIFPWRVNVQGLGFQRLFLGVESPREYMGHMFRGARSSYSPEAIDFVNKLPVDKKVLFLGEARTFYVSRPVIAPTVFDSKLIDGIDEPGPSGRAFWELLRENRIDYVYVSLPELSRLQNSYVFEHKGKVHPGYSDWLTPSVINATAGKYLSPVAAFSHSEIAILPPFMIYRVVPEERRPEVSAGPSG